MKKILILEDDRGIALTYAKNFKSKGYETTVAYNGAEGLKILETLKPDLIILDVNMPVMNGLEFYQRISNEQEKPKHPVMLLTARNDLERIFKELHIEGFLIKPINGERLFHEVDIIFKMHQIEKATAKKRVTIIDNRKNVEEISKTFSEAGYKVETADSGVWGIEKIMIDPPDLVLVYLGLKDLAGDLVILRLHTMAKTSRVPCILYIDSNEQHEFDPIVMTKLSEKTGVKQLHAYKEPKDLLQASLSILKPAGE